MAKENDSSDGEYTQEIGKEFWYDFDNQTLWNRTDEVSDAIRRGYFDHGLNLDSLSEELRTSFALPNHPEPFVDRINAGKAGLLDLGAIQLRIIDSHLGDSTAIRSAYEDFGQGVLFDDRLPRRPTRFVHMMDGTPDTWVGYQRWHAFIRAAALLSESLDRWLHLDRSMALAWAIQTEANPTIDEPNNPGLPPERLAKLRAAWMSLSFQQLDWAFATHRFRAPSLDALRAAGVMIPCAEEESYQYPRVQQILEQATGSSASPNHSGAKRFWLLPLNDFLALPPIYGQNVIASPGPDRGARSALVKILKNELPGFPQMPLNRPPVSADDIAYIENWINSLPDE